MTVSEKKPNLKVINFEDKRKKEQEKEAEEKLKETVEEAIKAIKSCFGFILITHAPSENNENNITIQSICCRTGKNAALELLHQTAHQIMNN